MPYQQFYFLDLFNRLDKLKKLKKTPYFEDEESHYSAGLKNEFMNLTYIEVKLLPNNKFKDKGWKFHISIDDHDEKNLATAWQIVVDTLIPYGVECFKVCKPDVHMDSCRKDVPSGFEYSQRGKQITIYDCNNIFCEIVRKYGKKF